MNPPLADGYDAHNHDSSSSSTSKPGSSGARPDSDYLPNSPTATNHQAHQEIEKPPSAPRVQNSDPEYVPPKRVLDALKKSDDLAPQSDIIVNVKRRTLRRTKKFSDPAWDWRLQDVDPSMSSKDEQFFADLEMSTPISTEQLRQILEDSACEEAKNLGRRQRRRAEKNEGTTEEGEGKMHHERPPLKIKLRKLGKRTCSSPARSRKDSNSETDGGSQCNVPKDNGLPKAHVQKFSKGLRRKRQTCRKQFRHKDITLYKLGAGQEKSSVPKNQVIHKIFARRSSTTASSPPAPKSETDSPQEEVSEQNLPVADVKSSEKCSENVTLDNSISTRVENKSNNEYPNQAKFPSSVVKTTLNDLHAETLPKNGQNYSLAAKRRDDVIPQLQIRDETPSSLNCSTTAPLGHQMVIRNEIGKHNLPIRIPERRTSIAEPLRTPPVLSKVPSFHTENRGNLMKPEGKDVTLDQSEVILSESGSSRDNNSLPVTKLKDNQLSATPFVKLCRLPDTPTSFKKVDENASENHERNTDSFLNKDLIEIKNIQIDTTADESKPNSVQVQTNGGKTETNDSIYKYNDNSSVSCNPENLSIKLVKSCSGITDPLKLLRPFHLQNKKNELNSKNRNSSTTSPNEGYYHNHIRSENQDACQIPSSPKATVEASGANYKNSSILQQNLLLKPGYKLDPYRNIPLRRNSNSFNNSPQEMPPYSSSSPLGSNSEALHAGTHKLPRNMPIIEEANQQTFSQTAIDNTRSESPKKYKRVKRKSAAETLESPPAKLYRGNNYPPYNNYNYPLHIYAGNHANSPYGSLPPFPIGAPPPPPYTFCPPIYQPRQPKHPQPPASDIRCEAPAFPNPRPIMQPFLTQDPRQPLALPNAPSLEAYNTRMNYEHFLRFNNAVFANRGPLNLDYISAPGNNRKKKTAEQNISPTVKPDALDFSSANFPRNNTRQNIYQPFAIPEAHQQLPKITDTQTTPLALIKNVTTSHCAERNIPIISRNEELTITKVPVKENLPNSSIVSKGHDISNLISSLKRTEFQKNDKLQNGGINSLIKVSRGNTEFIGPLRYCSSKIEIPHKPLYSIAEHSFPNKFAHSELASISVSIVKSTDKHSPVQQHKPVMASHTSTLPLSEQIKLLNSERAYLISQKSESAKVNSNMINNSSAHCTVTPKADLLHILQPDKEVISCQTAKSSISTDKDEVRETLRPNCSSPHSVSGCSTITDVERESEVEEASPVITIITDEKEQSHPKPSEEVSQVGEATPSPKIVESVSATPDIFSQVTDELISGILSQPSTRKEFIKSLHALTFIVNNMLYNSDRISEEEKTKLRNMLEGPIKNFNAETPCSSDLSDSVPSQQKTEIIATMQNVIKHNSTIATSANTSHEIKSHSTEQSEIDEENSFHNKSNSDTTSCTKGAIKDSESDVIFSTPTSPTEHTKMALKEDKSIQAESNVSEKNEILNSTVTNVSTVTQTKNIDDVTASNNHFDKQNTLTVAAEEKKCIQQKNSISETNGIPLKITNKSQCPSSNEFKGETTEKSDISSVAHQLDSSDTSSYNINVEPTNNSKTCDVDPRVSDFLPSETVVSPLLYQEDSPAKSSDPSMTAQSSIEVECSTLTENKSGVNIIKKVVTEDKGDTDSNDTSPMTSYSANDTTPLTNEKALPLNSAVNTKIEEKHSQLRQFRISSAVHGRKLLKVNEPNIVQHCPNSRMTQNFNLDSILNLAADASTDKEQASEYINDEKAHQIQSHNTAQHPNVLSASETKLPSDIKNRDMDRNDSLYTSETDRTENVPQISQSYPVIQHSTSLDESKTEMRKVELSQTSRTSPLVDGIQNDNNNITDYVRRENDIAEEKKSNMQTNISNSSISRRNSSNGEAHYDKSTVGDNVTTSLSRSEVNECQLTQSSDAENHSGENVLTLNDIRLHEQDDIIIITPASPNLSPTDNTESASSKLENATKSNNNHLQLCNTEECNLDQNMTNMPKCYSRTEEFGTVIQMLPVIQHHNSKTVNSHVTQDGTNITSSPNTENISQDIVISCRSSETQKNVLQTQERPKESTISSSLDTETIMPPVINNDNSGNSHFISEDIILTPLPDEHSHNLNKGNGSMSQNNASPDINAPAVNITPSKTSVNIEYVHKQGIHQRPTVYNIVPSSKESLETATFSPPSGSPLNIPEYKKDPRVYHPHRGPQEHLETERTASNSKVHSQNETECQRLPQASIMQSSHHNENSKINSSDWTRWIDSSTGAPMGGYNFTSVGPYTQQPAYSGRTHHHRHPSEFVRNAIGDPKVLRNGSIPPRSSIHDKDGTHMSHQSPPLNKRLHETSTNPAMCYKYATHETNQNIERHAMSEASKDELSTRESGEKRPGDESSKTLKRKRRVSNEKPEMLHKLDYSDQSLYQPQVPYHTDNTPFRMYPTYPLENLDCRRPVRTHLAKELPFTSDGIVNYAKPSSLLPPQLQSKPNLEQSSEVSNKGLDMRNPARENPARQPVIYNSADAINQTNYVVHANYNNGPSFRQNSIQERNFAHKNSHGSFADMQSSHGSVNTRTLADLKEKCLRGNANLQPAALRSPEANVNSNTSTRLSKDNQNHLRINANVPNFSNNISPDYGYFSPLSKNAPTHFETPVHHHPPLQYNEANACSNLQYRRLSNSSQHSQHSTADSLESYRHTDTIPNNSCNNVSVVNTSGNTGYVKHNIKLPPNPLASPVQNKAFPQETSIMPQNYNVQEKISSILPKLQQGGTLTPEQYVAEMSMLEKDGCPRPFMEFYSYVTKKQISSNQLPISFRIFLEFQNAGKLKTFEKAFKIYSEKHEKEKKVMKSTN